MAPLCRYLSFWFQKASSLAFNDVTKGLPYPEFQEFEAGESAVAERKGIKTPIRCRPLL